LGERENRDYPRLGSMSVEQARELAGWLLKKTTNYAADGEKECDLDSRDQGS
jgi:hypothetical protein